jgi:hypothetical protein
MLKELTNLANSLDANGMMKEADLVDRIIKESEAGRLTMGLAGAAVSKGVFSPEQLAQLASKLTAEELRDIMTNDSFDDAKREATINLLIADPKMHAILAKALGLQPGLLTEIMTLGPAVLQELGAASSGAGSASSGAGSASSGAGDILSTLGDLPAEILSGATK